MKYTEQAAAVLALFLEDVEKEWYGNEIASRANLNRSVVHDICQRFWNIDWLTRRDEDIKRAGRQRIYYKLTRLGIKKAPGYKKQPRK